jgi:hypothetical protein
VARPTALFQLIDDRYDGHLEEHLRTWTAASVSIQAISRLIRQQTGVDVSGQTVRRWLLDTPDDEPNGRTAAA